MGVLTAVLVDCTRTNSGVSMIFRRMNRPTTTSKALSRKAMRQPQARNSASVVKLLRM